MATSGETDFVETAGDLIHSAAREIGAISMGAELEDAEMDECLKRLSRMLKSWSTQANLFREWSGTLTLTPNVGAVSLPPDLRDISTVRLVLTGGQTRPLAPWNRDQYFSIPNREQPGNPIAYYWSHQADADILYVWPVPTKTITLELTYSGHAQTVTSALETIDLPQEWNEAVVYNLASRIASIFGASQISPAAVQRCDAIGQALYQRLLDVDRPDSYYFERY